MYNNVTIRKKPNIFYEGRVCSWTIILNDGSKKSLGIMLPGEYEFKPPADEIMEFMTGEADIQLPGDSWVKVYSNDKFQIAANTSFKVRVKTLTEYCCDKDI